MGWDHVFYLMNAVTYTKLLRPKLIEYYGIRFNKATRNPSDKLYD